MGNVIEFPKAVNSNKELKIKDIEEFENLMFAVVSNLEALDRDSLERAYCLNVNFCKKMIRDIYMRLEELKNE